MEYRKKHSLLIVFTLIFISAAGQENYQIKNIEFEGNQVLEDDMLAEKMNSREMNVREKLFFWKKTPRYSSIVLENDIERLKNFYQRNGFLNPEIISQLHANDKREKVSIDIEIKEGQAYIINEITFQEGSRAVSPGIIELIEKDLPLRSGDRFEDQKIFTAMDIIQKAYRNEGYPFTDVKKDIQVNKKDHTVDINLSVFPGKKARISDIKFQGDSLIPESFIKKQLRFKEGDVYSLEKLEKSQESIFETGLFQYAIIRAQKDSMRNGSLPILIRVKELNQWSFEGGVGYGTEDRFRLSGMLIKRHFLGGARRLMFEAKRSHYLPISLDTKLVQPNLFNRQLDLVLNPFFLREREESYEVDRLGAGITLQKRISATLSSYITYTVEQDNLLDRTIVESDSLGIDNTLIHNKSGVTLGMNKNSTNNIFEPTKGWRIESYFTYMGFGFRSSHHYYKVGLDVRHYKELNPGFILAGRFHGGIIQSLLDDESTPIEDRFLIGGASSLRGWSRNSISPENEEGLAVGGNSMMEGSIELRFPVYDIISGTTFIDAGNVWRETYAYDPSDLYYNTGVGLRVQTPIGPIRLDVAFPLFQGDFSTNIYISLGHAF